eukprot:scaffold161619_cov36-Tisochrysis_lutea.AAC.1
MAGTTIAVVYADSATVRSRLVRLAQGVRARLACERDFGESGHPLPTLALPRCARFGFWHMGFASEEAYVAAETVLQGRPFSSDCGSLNGQLVFHREVAEFESVVATATCSLMLDPTSLDAAKGWLTQRFATYGTVVNADVPQLGRSNWDPGIGTVTLSDAVSAEQAIECVDGTPSFIMGDNIAAFPHIPYISPADSFAGAASLIEQLRLLRVQVPVGDF